MRIVVAAFAALLAIGAMPARAEVTASSPSAFASEGRAEIAADPGAAWAALIQVENWWAGAHTYSGAAANLSLEPSAGGCWCERWSDNSVEHGRVVMAGEVGGVRTLRVLGGFGPLQAMGVSGVLTYTISSHANGAQVTMSYRVSGDSGLGLDQLAAIVDQVQMEQFGRLVRFIETGSPE